MKFSCLQENLSQGLNINSRLAGTSKTSLPILNNILLTAQKGFLKLSTTNLEMAIETKIRAKIEKEGKITIPAQLFNNYIDLLPNEALNLETVKNELIIKSKKQKAKIKGISAEEFPIIPQIESQEKYLIQSDVFKDALEKTIFAISPSEVRVELSGALFSFNLPEANRLTIVGTDSYRLTEREIPLKKVHSKNKKNIIIPIRTLQEFLRIIKGEGDTELYLSENQVLFTHQNTELVSRIISGEYPDYKQTIPETIKTKALISKADFLRTVKAASFFAKLGVNDINLKFLPKENQLLVSSLNSQVGENKAILPAEITGQANEIVFNYRYLIDGLTNLPGEEVNLEIVNDDTPGLIKSTTDQFYLYLIMPIKNG
ncbi:DNA polymerase III subunit beta [Patescibacteria group bacterium]|nr:DNA polymerase III subunit beta [Patescibacteria group bacterium]